jgi:hypothetical protein
METGKVYPKVEIEKFHKDFSTHYPYVYGVNLDNNFYIKFGQFEFWEQEENMFLCTRNENGYIVEPKQVTAFHDRAKRKTKAYWTRDNAATREANKWGHRPNG